MLMNIETTDRRNSHYPKDLRKRAQKRRQSQAILGRPGDPYLTGEHLALTHQRAKWSFYGTEPVEPAENPPSGNCQKSIL